jgi:lactoylglutathione lyase
MKLAKPRIDIGFATNDAPAALAFWQNEIGLPFDHTQPIRRGYKQHRFRTIRRRVIASF